MAYIWTFKAWTSKNIQESVIFELYRIDWRRPVNETFLIKTERLSKIQMSCLLSRIFFHGKDHCHCHCYNSPERLPSPVWQVYVSDHCGCTHTHAQFHCSAVHGIHTHCQSSHGRDFCTPYFCFSPTTLNSHNKTLLTVSQADTHYAPLLAVGAVTHSRSHDAAAAVRTRYIYTHWEMTGVGFFY